MLIKLLPNIDLMLIIALNEFIFLDIFKSIIEESLERISLNDIDYPYIMYRVCYVDACVCMFVCFEFFTKVGRKETFS